MQLRGSPGFRQNLPCLLGQQHYAPQARPGLANRPRGEDTTGARFFSQVEVTYPNKEHIHFGCDASVVYEGNYA